MKNEIEFGKWYDKNSLSYYFEKENLGGTNVFVRGKISPLNKFIYQLDKYYFPNEERFTEKRYTKHIDLLLGVLNSGKVETEPICFGDDRIRNIQRMDKYVGSINGPYVGKKEFLELCHNEQYGGEYPGDSLFNSRAGMIEKVLDAINNME